MVDTVSGNDQSLTLKATESDTVCLGLLRATARAMSDVGAGTDKASGGSDLAMSIVNRTLWSWQENALSLLDDAFNSSHNENCHVCRSSSYILDPVRVHSEEVPLQRKMMLKQSTNGRNQRFAAGDDSGATKELLIVEKTLAGATHVPTCRASGYVADGSIIAPGEEVRLLVESCVAPEQALSHVLTLTPGVPSIQGHKADHRSARDPSHFVRLSIVVPEAYVGILRDNQQDKNSDRTISSSLVRKEAVLASLIIWFDGYSLEVPAYVMSSLVKMSRRAAYILTSNYLQHCIYSHQRARLETMLFNAAERHQTSATAHSGIHAAIMKLLDVTNTDKGEAYDDDVRVTAEIMGLSRLASTMAKLEDNYTDAAAATMDEEVEPVARPLSPQEASWLRGNLQGWR